MNKQTSKDQSHFWSTNVVHATAGLLVLWPELTQLSSLRTLAKKYSFDYVTLEEAANGLVNIGLLEKQTRRAKGIWAPVQMFRRSAQIDLDVIVQKTVLSEKEGEKP